MEAISETIARLRKQAGVTQEELANAVGVSPQAVSKWECGGLPDVTLVPAIAAFLHVSTDELFGCAPANECADFTPALWRELYENGGYSTGDPARLFDDMLACIFSMHQSVFKDGGRKAYTTVAEAAMGDGAVKHTSEMIFNEGVSILNLEKVLPAAFILKQPEDPSVLKMTGDMKELFALLADEDGAKLLYAAALYSKNDEGYWSAEKLAERLGVSETYLRENLSFLEKNKLVMRRDVTVDGEVHTSYVLTPHNAVYIVGILAMAVFLTRNRQWYSCYCSNRTRPWIE